MSPSKLGWHFQSLSPWDLSIVNSDWVKIIDPPSTNPFPGKKVIGRTYIPDGTANNMVMLGAAGAEQWLAQVQGAYQRAPWVWCWEGPNEPPVQTSAQRAALVAFTRRWVELMHAGLQQGGPPLRTVALCIGVGWPDIGQAPDLAGALDKTDYWAVHEYSAPTLQNNQSWLCLRYRRTVQELQGVAARIPPLLITECGLDGGVIGRPATGWKTYADRAGYLNQLTWYDGELRKDDYVQAAVIFTSGPNYDWTDFDVNVDFSRDLSSYIESQKQTQPPPPPPPPTPTPTPDFTLKRPLPAGVGWVWHWFGEPVQDYSESNLSGHNGLDYIAPAGSAVLAAHDGQCATGQDASYGTYVRITAAASTFSTIYAHLQDAVVSDGQQVTAGTVIGHVGSTGKAASPNLHFGWRVTSVRNPAYGDWLDPLLGRKLNGDA